MDNNSNINRDEVFSKRIKAGKRTYFFDVKATRGNDYYVTITESKRKQDGYGYDKHKIFLYKEDFNKFIQGLDDAVSHIKKELMPGYDFEKFDNEAESVQGDGQDFESGFDQIGGYDSLDNVEEIARTQK
jgi:viroplasmin and RNaseH domain-containing protein